MRILNTIDEYTKKRLSMRIDLTITASDLIELLKELFVMRGIPEHMRSGNGPEFVAELFWNWLRELRVNTLFIEPGSPWGEWVFRIVQRELQRSIAQQGDL
jgi:hypothetical protein